MDAKIRRKTQRNVFLWGETRSFAIILSIRFSYSPTVMMSMPLRRAASFIGMR